MLLLTACRRWTNAEMAKSMTKMLDTALLTSVGVMIKLRVSHCDLTPS